jgi:hypothetical protein
MIAACGVVLQVLHRYRINYVSIFEIEIKHKVTYMKLYRVSSMGFEYFIIDCHYPLWDLDILLGLPDLRDKNVKNFR